MDTLRFLAIHEAGHVVAAMAVGFPVRTAWITSSAGICFAEMPAPLVSREDRIRAMVFYCAGPAATSMLWRIAEMQDAQAVKGIATAAEVDAVTELHLAATGTSGASAGPIPSDAEQVNAVAAVMLADGQSKLCAGDWWNRGLVLARSTIDGNRSALREAAIRLRRRRCLLADDLAVIAALITATAEVSDG